jgi:orotidine-5'-phosphate decarboxylase
MVNLQIKKRIAEAAVNFSIVGTNFSEPITFRSGIKSPIYCDWRAAQAHQTMMTSIRLGLVDTIHKNGFDKNTCVIAGVATGAVPHATLAAASLDVPSCYIRPGASSKTYGLGKLIEGASVKGKKVFVIEDLVSTGGSILENIRILKMEGATEVVPICIFSYGFPDIEKEFAAEQTTLLSVLTASDLLPVLQGKVSSAEYDLLTEWLRNPKTWFDNNKTNFNFGYLTTLRQSYKLVGHPICLGGDPLLEALPEEFDQSPAGIVQFFIEYFHLLKSNGMSPAAFKPNEGYYTCLDKKTEKDHSGSNALIDILKLFSEMFPGIPKILDIKRGDIETSSANYAQDLFGYDVDAVTISGYMGSDSVEPFTKHCNKVVKKGIYILAKTSNKGAVDIQNLQTISGEPVYSVVGNKIIEWGKKKPGVGAVVGATSKMELELLAKKFAGKDIPLLIPGVGGQGGKGNEVIAILKSAGIELDIVRINSSSGLTHPWYSKSNRVRGGADWKDQCLRAFENMITETTFYL